MSELVRDKPTEISGVDTNGRTLVVRKPNLLDMYRLMRMLGQASSNQAQLQIAMTVSCIVSIDGETVRAPSNEREIEALCTRIDFAGLLKAQELLGTFEVGGADADAAKN